MRLDGSRAMMNIQGYTYMRLDGYRAMMNIQGHTYMRLDGYRTRQSLVGLSAQCKVLHPVHNMYNIMM